MEPFHAERKGNEIIINREPETLEEWQTLRNVISDAIIYAMLDSLPNDIYD